jgi:hypothetical protein
MRYDIAWAAPLKRTVVRRGYGETRILEKERARIGVSHALHKQMGEIADLLRLAYEITKGAGDRRKGVDDKSWDALILIADELHELLQKHHAAITAVVAPAIYERDVRATFRAYRELLTGVSVFAAAYEDAQGVLGAAQRFRQFQQGPGKNEIALIRHRLGTFQSSAFCLSWSSADMADLLSESSKLFELLSEKPASTESSLIEPQRERIRQSYVLQAFPSLLSRGSHAKPVLDEPPLNTKDDVANLARRWCKAWLERVTQLLYEGGICDLCNDTKHEHSRYGLHRLLGQLKGARFEG